MPQTPHIERHFTGSATVRDLVIGMSDGLTVPFVLAAGLRLFFRTLFRRPRLFPLAITPAIYGFHFYLAAELHVN